MTYKEKLIYLIEHYNTGDYTTWDFCSEWHLCRRDDGEGEELSEFSEEYMRKLDHLCDYYSPFPEDFELYPYFVHEEEIKEYVKDFRRDFIY